MGLSSLHNCLPSLLILFHSYMQQLVQKTLISLVEKGKTQSDTGFRFDSCSFASGCQRLIMDPSLHWLPCLQGLKTLPQWMVVLDVHVVEPQLVITQPRTMYLGDSENGGVVENYWVAGCENWSTDRTTCCQQLIL